MASVLLLLAIAGLYLSKLVDAAPGTPRGFIRAVGGRFVDEDCVEYVPFGWNWWPYPVVYQAISAVAGDRKAIQYVDEVFATAKNASFNTFRLFAHGVEGGIKLHITPGVYNETVWRAIDYTVAKAGEFGMKVVLSPVNSWQGSDGFFDYLKWAGIPEDDPARFYSDPQARQLYRDHLAAMATRKNHVTGIAYKDDPAVFSWNLMNELRGGDWSGPPSAVVEIGQWVAEMSKHLKSVAPNTMVTVGSEAFFAMGSGSEAANPYGSTGSGELLPTSQFWAAWTGQDSFSQLIPDDIDYLSMHQWPDNWRTPDFSWATGWVAAQQVVAARAGKPLFMEEFGKIAANWTEVPTVRNAWYNFWMNAFVEALENGAPLRGVTFWDWETIDVQDAKGTPGLVLYTHDATWNLLQDKWAPLIKQAERALHQANTACSGGGGGSIASVAPAPPSPVTATMTVTTTASVLMQPQSPEVQSPVAAPVQLISSQGMAPVFPPQALGSAAVAGTSGAAALRNAPPASPQQS